MRRALGLWQCAVLGLGVLVGSAVIAADASTVSRFVSLSDRFQSQLARPATRGLSAAQKRARAVCILTQFETEYGQTGVRALMDLMSVLSRNPEFDDPTVVAFNERYGGTYGAAVAGCTRSARGS